MPRRVYNKLVRDRIPEIIAADGRTPEVETLDEAAFVLALKQKLVEEAHEVFSATDADIPTELADLQEVIDALIASCGIDRTHIATLQTQRRHSRGGFTRRLRLLSVE